MPKLFFCGNSIAKWFTTLPLLDRCIFGGRKVKNWSQGRKNAEIVFNSAARSDLPVGYFKYIPHCSKSGAGMLVVPRTANFLVGFINVQNRMRLKIR